MVGKFSFFLSLFLALCAFLGILIWPAAATGGARAGLLLCSGMILPSLFPFAVLGNRLVSLGIPALLSRLLSPLTKKLFGVSGAGTTAIFLGLAGGYPLGAISVAELYETGLLERQEANRLLGFCNNAGPAFIVSVAGSAVFGDTRLGFFLYATHLMAALLTGLLLKGRASPGMSPPPSLRPQPLSAAFTGSVKKAAGTMVTVCGFVVFFSVLVGILDATGLLTALTGSVSVRFGTELHFSRSLLTGLLELGTGISSMFGLRANRETLALAAFLLAWGGLSVHAQAAAVISEGGLSPARHSLGKLVHGVLSAALTFFVYPLMSF